MRFLRESALEKALQGSTTLREHPSVYLRGLSVPGAPARPVRRTPSRSAARAALRRLLAPGGDGIRTRARRIPSLPSRRGSRVGPLGVPAGDDESLADSVRTIVARASRPVRECPSCCRTRPSMVIERGDPPAEPQARLEVLRFRIRRMVPYRVEDLRIQAVPIGPRHRSDAHRGRGPARRAMSHHARELCGLHDDRGRLLASRHPYRSAFGRDAGDAPGGEPGGARAGLSASRWSTPTASASCWCGPEFRWTGVKGFPRASQLPTARGSHLELRLTRTFLSERFAGEQGVRSTSRRPGRSSRSGCRCWGRVSIAEPTRLALEHLSLTVRARRSLRRARAAGRRGRAGGRVTRPAGRSRISRGRRRQ